MLDFDWRWLALIQQAKGKLDPSAIIWDVGRKKSSGESCCLLMREGSVHEIQRLSRHGCPLSHRSAGIRIRSVEQSQIRIASLPLDHQKCAAFAGRVNSGERIVLREIPRRFGGKRMRLCR